MNLSRMIYTGKVIGRALLSGFSFNRIRQARQISMDLNSSTTGNQSTLEIEVSDSTLDYIDFKRCPSTVSGRCRS
jgi:hypothetical protein